MTGPDVARLIDAHAAGLVLFARTYCRAPEDVVMTVFGKLAGLRDPPGEPAAWLFRVVKHAAIDVGKAEAPPAASGACRCQTGVVVRRQTPPTPRSAVESLQALPAELRDVVVLRLWGGLTLHQVADALSCSVSSAHRRYESAIDQLRAALGEVPRD